MGSEGILRKDLVLLQLRQDGAAKEVAEALRLYRAELIATDRHGEAEWLLHATLTDDERRRQDGVDGKTKLTVAAVQELVAQLVKARLALEAELSRLKGRIDDFHGRPPPTPELLQAIRAAGVTRYQAGELVIELNPAAAPGPPEQRREIGAMMSDDCGGNSGGPWPGAFEQFARAAREAGWLDKKGEPPPDDDAPPGAPEPAESPSGFGIDHDALAAKLEERARAMERPAK